MAFNIPALRKLIRDGEQDIAYELDLPSLPPFGVERAVNVSFSSQIRDLYDHQRWIKDQIIPSVNADDDTIIEIALTEGVIRKQATYAAGRVTFPGQGGIPADTEMQTVSGALFVVTTSGVSQSGQTTVTVRASDAGAAGNLPEGTSVTLLSPIPGVDSAGAVAAGGVTGGADIEPIAELLDRLLYRKRNPPVGGALHDYVIWAREVPGVSRAWVWDTWHGPATVGLAWVYDDRADIVPGYQDKKDMEAYLFRHRDPATGDFVGKPGGIEVWPMILTLRAINMSIRLIPDTDATRAAVRTNLTVLFRTLIPEQKLLVTSLRTAIGVAVGVKDYALSITEDIPAGKLELISLGGITWLTA